MELCLDANFGNPFIHRCETGGKVSKAPVNHEFAPLRMTAVEDVAVCLTFTPLCYLPHLLDVSPAFYEGCRQLDRGTIPIESPDVPGAYP